MKKLATILMMAVLFVAAGSISARAGEVKDSTFIVKVGLMAPNGTNLANSNSNFSAGGEYEFSTQGQQKNQAWSISADYTQVQRLDGGTSTVFPLLANYKWYSAMGGDTRGFLGIGIGAVLGDFSGFAYQGMAGLQFAHNWQVEIRYIGDSGNQRVGIFGTQLQSVFGADLGFRF